MKALITLFASAFFQALADAFLGWMKDRQAEETTRALGAAEAGATVNAATAETADRIGAIAARDDGPADMLGRLHDGTF